MSQPTNYIVSDGTGAQVLQAINNQIQSIRDCHSGPVEPANAFLGQLFYNTDNNTLNIYNGSFFAEIPFDPLTGDLSGTTFINIPLSALDARAIDLDLSDGVSPDSSSTAGSLVSAAAVANYVDAHTSSIDNVHGLQAESEVVGTNEAQTISNKTLNNVKGLSLDQDTDLGNFRLTSEELKAKGNAFVGGDLTVDGIITQGGTQLESSTTININDKTLSLASNATTQVGINSSGILLGDDGSSGHLESFLYTNTGGWEASAPLLGEGFKVENSGTDKEVINNSGDWVGNTIPLTKGGTGGTSATSARTNLGLGVAATKNIGYTANDVSQGDHTHSTIDGTLETGKGGTGTITTPSENDILVGTASATYKPKALQVSGNLTIANNNNDVTIGLDASTLSGITPTGTPTDGQTITADVTAGVTSYGWETPVESLDVNWDGATLSGTASTARDTIQATGNIAGTSSAAVEGFSFNVNETVLDTNSNIDGDQVTLELIYSDGKNTAGSRKVLASINLKDMLANVNIT